MPNVFLLSPVGPHGMQLSSRISFEDFTRIPVEVEYASEFRTVIIYPDDVVNAISQLRNGRHHRSN